MSVRRLAEDKVQPAAFAFSSENAAWAEATIKKYPKGREQSAVIPLLMRAQDQDGWVTKAAIESIADMLGMAYIRVLEVATFYTQFQLKPIGTRAHVQVCGTTPCMLRGSEELIKVCKRKIHEEQFTQNESGTLSWEEVECLGACVNAPMVMIFKDTYEDLTPLQLEYIIERFDAGRSDEVRKGPQIDRVHSAPFGGPTTLLEETVPVTFAQTQAAAAAKAEADAKAKAEADAKAKAEADAATKSAVEPAAALAEAVSSPTKAAAAVGIVAPEVIATPAAPERVEVGTSEKAKAADAAVPSLDDPNRPAAVARPDKVDDVKLISGVGPVIEKKLHDLGIYTFAQIANWTAAEINWVDGYLKFRGRIERDGWIAQAAALARGGVEEYVKVFGKDPR